MGMVAVSPLFPVHTLMPDEEPRIVLSRVPWKTYVLLRDALEGRRLHMTYLEGELEIMSPSGQHEISKKQVARLLELFCLERNIPLFAYGETTWHDEAKQRGLEADESYARGGRVGMPDVAIEVIVTHGLLDKLEVYRGLGVREVWLFEKGKFKVLALGERGYAEVERSGVFPEVDHGRIAHYALMEDQHAALLAFRAELRGS